MLLSKSMLAGWRPLRSSQGWGRVSCTAQELCNTVDPGSQWPVDDSLHHKKNVILTFTADQLITYQPHKLELVSWALYTSSENTQKASTSISWNPPCTPHNSPQYVATLHDGNNPGYPGNRWAPLRSYPHDFHLSKTQTAKFLQILHS